jgi:hypothetical protein
VRIAAIRGHVCFWFFYGFIVVPSLSWQIIVLGKVLKTVVRRSWPSRLRLCYPAHRVASVRTTPLFAPFVYKNDHFTKPGSGQT